MSRSNDVPFPAISKRCVEPSYAALRRVADHLVDSGLDFAVESDRGWVIPGWAMDDLLVAEWIYTQIEKATKRSVKRHRAGEWLE